MAEPGNDLDETAHFTYIWTIENASSTFYGDSPTFSVEAMEMTKWYLDIDCLHYESITLAINRAIEDNGPDSVELKFELSFLKYDGTPLMKEVKINNFYNRSLFRSTDFADKDEVFFERRAEFLYNDALTIRCRMWRTGTEISKQDLCFARTHLRPNRHSFIWAVREFSSLQRNQERKLVNTTENKQITFKLFIREDDAIEYVGIGIQIPENEYCCIEICILDFEGKLHSSVEKDFFVEEYEIENIFQKSKLMEDKECLLPNNVLTLEFEFEMEAKAKWSRIENYRYLNSKGASTTAIAEGEILCYEKNGIYNSSSSFVESIKSLLDESTLSDINLRTNSKSFPAHKCILSARSPVFKAMFSGDMKEKTSKSVEIPDVDEDTMRELLYYIYTDKLGKLEWRSVTDLYRAADKYELLDLKRRCAVFLQSDFSINNVCVILNVADLHNDSELRESAEDFVMSQGAEFFTSDVWQSFKKENPTLAMEILQQIVCNMKRHCNV